MFSTFLTRPTVFTAVGENIQMQTQANSAKIDNTNYTDASLLLVAQRVIFNRYNTALVF